MSKDNDADGGPEFPESEVGSSLTRARLESAYGMFVLVIVSMPSYSSSTYLFYRRTNESCQSLPECASEFVGHFHT
jgi:hypothetical protein